MTEKQPSDEKVRSLKLQVLNEHRDFLCKELGDPARYLPYLSSKGVLDENNVERIKSKATNSDKVTELVESLTHCSESYNGHPLDVLIEGIKRQKVQLHISRMLSNAANKLIRDTTPQGENFQLDTPVGRNMPSPGNRPPRRDYNRSSVEGDLAEHDVHQIAGHNGSETHPEYGPLPPHLPPPALKMDGIATSNYDNGGDMHPEYGPLPSTPPTTIRYSDESSDSISSLERLQQQQQQPSSFCRSPNPVTSGDGPTFISTKKGCESLQGAPPFITGYAHSDDSEYYKAQLEQKDKDIRSLQSQLYAEREENLKLKARIDELEAELKLARQGRGGGAGASLGAPRPAHLPFSRSPEHHHPTHLSFSRSPEHHHPTHLSFSRSPEHHHSLQHAHSASTPQPLALHTPAKGDEHLMRHDKHFSTGKLAHHVSSHHSSLTTPSSLATPINSSTSVTTPITLDSRQQSKKLSIGTTTVTLASTGNEHSTDV